MKTPPVDLLELVHSIMHDYRSLQYRFLRDGPHDITHMDSKVLEFFARNAGASQADLVAHSNRDKAQVARLIKGLKERGLLEGEADAEDRRSIRLHLTSRGKEVQSVLRQQAKHLSEKAVAGLGPTQQKQLLSLLRAVKENLNAGETRDR